MSACAIHFAIFAFFGNPSVFMKAIYIACGYIALSILNAGFFASQAIINQVILPPDQSPDRKSTRLNSSHLVISYAVFCLKNQAPAAHSPPLKASSSGQLTRIGVPQLAQLPRADRIGAPAHSALPSTRDARFDVDLLTRPQ